MAVGRGRYPCLSDGWATKSASTSLPGRDKVVVDLPVLAAAGVDGHAIGAGALGSGAYTRSLLSST